MKKRIIRIVSICLILTMVFAISVFAASFSSSSLSSGANKTIFSSKTLRESADVNITQDYATIISTSRDACVRYVLKRADTGVFMDYDYLDGEDSTTLNPCFDNVSSNLVAYNDESSAIKFSGSYSIS